MTTVYADRVATYLTNIGEQQTEPFEATWIKEATEAIVDLAEGRSPEELKVFCRACADAYPLPAPTTLGENGHLILLDVNAAEWTTIRQITNPSGFKADYVDLPPMIRFLDRTLGKANWSLTTDSPSPNVIVATASFLTPAGGEKKVSGVSGFVLAPIPAWDDLPEFDGLHLAQRIKEYGKLIKAINEVNQNAVKEAETDAQKRALAKAGLTLHLWEKS